MRINEIIGSADVIKTTGEYNGEIEKLCIDSKLCRENSLYFCLKGENFNGNDFIEEAIKNGVKAIVTESEQPYLVKQIIVKDSRKAMAEFAANFYGNAHKSLKLVGVTGTNGKTTTCHIIESILKKCGKKVGIIGTLGIRFGTVSVAPTLTTPDPIYLHEIFSEMKESGVEYVVMEVSAHSIALNKLFNLDFEVGILTNCTQDHLDYFKSMEKYRATKKQFLTEGQCRYVIVNADDDLGKEILNTTDTALSYGITSPSDTFAIDVRHTLNGSEYIINLFDIIDTVKLGLIGEFNVYNSLAAASCCAVLGVHRDSLFKGLADLRSVDGRAELVGEYNGAKIFVDYAHTPDGLERILEAMRSLNAKRIICLFGCGGNRDTGKRKIMGEIAGKFADFTILTSDNPRFEEPCQIMSQIEKGMLEQNANYISIQNRKTAIGYAVNCLSEGDVLVIAGKGAEEYQEIMGVKHNFSDRKTVLELIEKA